MQAGLMDIEVNINYLRVKNTKIFINPRKLVFRLITNVIIIIIIITIIYECCFMLCLCIILIVDLYLGGICFESISGYKLFTGGFCCHFSVFFQARVDLALRQKVTSYFKNFFSVWFYTVSRYRVFYSKQRF